MLTCLDLSDMKHYPQHSRTSFCVSAITFLAWELDSNSMTPDQFHSLYQAMLVVASEGNAWAVETVYWNNVQPAQFWCKRYGPRLLYLLLCHGHEDSASELAKDMATEMCRAIFYPSEVDKMLRILQSMSCMYSQHPYDSRTSILSLSLRLVHFILHNQVFFFHSLCELGVCELVEFSLDVMSKDLRLLAFSRLDSRRMSPLYLAAANGHLDVVKVLVQRGHPLTHPNPSAIPALFAVAVCLRSTFPKAISKDWMNMNRLFPASFNGCNSSPENAISLRESASCIMKVFLSRLSGGIISFNDDFFTVLCILASTPSLDLATPMLRFFLQDTHHYTSPITLDESLVITGQLDQLIQLLPDHRSSPSCPSLHLFDQILLNFISVRCAQNLMPLASCRGLWGVVGKCYSLLLQDCPDPRSVTVELGILVDAAVQGEFDFLTSVLGNLCQGDISLYSDLIKSLLHMVTLHGGVEAVSFLLSFVSSVEVVTTPLNDAVRFHLDSSMDVLFNHLISAHQNISTPDFWRILKTAVCVSNRWAIEKLFELRDRVQGFKAREFWWQVFAGAIEHGHESLALWAVQHVSGHDIQEFTKQPHYLTLVGLCCYRGMVDLLKCIPWTAEALLEKLSKSCPTLPWVLSTIGEHIGILEAVPSSCLEIPDKKLLLEVFYSMMSRTTRTSVCETSHWRSSAFNLRMVVEALYCVLAEGIGEYKDIEMLKLLLRAACLERDNLPAVKLILQCLFNSLAATKSDKFSSRFDSGTFQLSVKMGMADYIRAFVCIEPLTFRSSQLDYPYLLNSAVYSGSPKMVNYILKLLGADAPDECYKMDNNGDYPILTAFALGRHQVLAKSSLVTVAAKSAKFHGLLEPDWREYACKSHGWFDLLMCTNSSPSGFLNAQSTAHHSDQPISSLMSLRDSEPMYAALIHQNLSVLQALLTASDGMLYTSDWRDIDVMYDPTVWKFLNAKCYRRNVFPSKDEEELKEQRLIRLVRRRIFKKETVAHLQLSRFSQSQILTEIYTSACAHGESEFIDYLLSLDAQVFKGDKVKLLGIKEAAATGHFKLAADLMLRMDHPLPLVMKSANPVHSYVFGDQSYDEILNAFFASLCCLNQRMPLASLWMTRGWSEEEARLVVNRLGCSTFAPPNPWVFSDDSAWDLSINVDWNSFSECTLTSPCVPTTGANGTEFRHVPLLVESIVFSQAVLGLLSPHAPPDSEEVGMNLFQYCRGRGYSSVIMTCQVWPAQPFLANGVLNFSYRPDTRTVHSVDLEMLTTKHREPTPLADPAVEYRNQLSENLCILRQQSLESLREHYEEVLGSVALCQKCSVSVKFSADIVGAVGGRTFEYYSSLISSQLGDLAESLDMVFRPSVLYKDLYPEYRAAARVPVKLQAFEKLLISLEDTFSDPSRYTTNVEVSLEHSTLGIKIWLPQPLVDQSDRPPLIPTLSSYSKLVQDLEEAILHAELSHIQEEGMRDLGRTLLASSLKAMTPDFLEVVIDKDLHSERRFEELDISRSENLVYFKCIYYLKRFLRLFGKMLMGVFQYEQMLHHHVISMFKAGLKVVLCKQVESKPGLSEQAGIPILHMPVLVLLSAEESRKALLQLFHDILAVGRKCSSKLESLSIPAPFISFVVLRRSNGLLYPVCGEAGVIIVQMVDYYRSVIETTPSVSCRLEVHIKHIASRATAIAVLSMNPNSRLASHHLSVVEGTRGRFKIKWTPQEYGMYSVSIHINGMAVSGSPFRCFSAISDSSVRIKRERGVARSWKKGSNGRRQTNTDSPIVCVISHSLTGSNPWVWQCQATTPPPVRLMNRKPIRGTPACVTQEEFLTELGSGERPIHHISMCSAYGGASWWGRTSSPFVSIHIYNKGQDCSHRFNVVTTPLGKGYYRASISSTIRGSFLIFASCTCCNSVLTMHWRDGWSFLPTSIYPFEFSGDMRPERSTLAMVSPSRKKGSSHRRPKKGLCDIEAARQKFRSMAESGDRCIQTL